MNAIPFFKAITRFFLTLLFLFQSAWADTPKIEVVVVSASYGAGHNTSAEAIKSLLESNHSDVHVTILYAENYMRCNLGQKSIRIFDAIYQNTPMIYDIGFQLATGQARNKKSAADIPQFVFSENKLLRDIVAIDPSVVYSTHHISTSMMIRLRRDHKLSTENFQIGWVDTDFVHEPFFYLNSLGVEKTFIAHPSLMKERILLGVPAEKMVVTSLPINNVVFEPFTLVDKANFFATALQTSNQPKPKTPLLLPETTWINGEDKNVGTHEIKLSPPVMTVTIASGGAGLGDYTTIFKGLVEEAKARGKKLQVIAVCGKNKTNFNHLTRYYLDAKKKGLMDGVILMVTGKMENRKLMNFVRSSQVFIGKSGSQSPIEAAIMGTPTVLLDVLGGQEHHTAEFFKKEELAVIVKKNQQKTTGREAFLLLEYHEKIDRMRTAQKLVRESYTMQPLLDFFDESIQKINEHGRVSLVPIYKTRSSQCNWRLTRLLK